MESYLIAVTSLRDVHLYSVSHSPQEKIKGEREGEREGEGRLLFKLLSTMTKRQIKSILSRAQLGEPTNQIALVTRSIVPLLGSSVETLLPMGSHEGEIALVANSHALLRIFSDPASHQLSFMAGFSIDPHLEEFDDDLLPNYVGGVSDVSIAWPLVFTLTEDGIICILINAQLVPCYIA